MSTAVNDAPSPNTAVLEAFAALSPEKKTDFILERIDEHPQSRLELPAENGQPVDLSHINLGALADRLDASMAPPLWWSEYSGGINLKGANLRGVNLALANLERADLREADLRGAILRGVNLRHAALERANLRGADLAGADLSDASLGEADLEGAMLEDARLEEANLRFANFRGACLEAANLSRADLWGGVLEKGVLPRANLSGAVLEEANLQQSDLTRVNLQGAMIGRADLRGSCLRGVDLSNATIGSANLEGADLSDSRLTAADLSRCNLAGIHLNGAWLEKTRLHREQLGGALAEELEGRYEEARLGYLGLERNFVQLGDADAASWAYCRKRRMQKLQAREQAVAAWGQGRRAVSAGWYLKYSADQAVEWLCDYGESVWRVLLTLLAVYLLFTLIYGLTGGVVRTTNTPEGLVTEPTNNPIDWVIFSMSAMSPTAKQPWGLLPRNEWIQLIASIQLFIGVALAGLVGFVFGNTSRR